jgi:pimeloyl-ACP methyl ester carboxylesterase|tara:strand:- start:3798 stop:4982 length:1185 start_codon:yes stop_codon:yes gene_type:complete
MLASCADDESMQEVLEEEALVEQLISAELISTRNAVDIKLFLSLSGLDFPLDRLVYNVQVWKVEYKTMYKGASIIASGMVYIPEGVDEKFSYLVFAHGTIASNSQAPTQIPSNDIQELVFAGMATAGLVTLVPDFIGFGSSAELMHPYYIEEPIALAVIDQLKAVKELLEQEKVGSDGEVYLSGYSQGGYVAMATHKYIEEKGLESFELKASFPAAGGYDMKGVRAYFFDQEIYQQPYYMAYIAEAYRAYYGYDNELISKIFNPPYDEKVLGIFDGINTDSEINDLLNDTVKVLINEAYLTNPDMGVYAEISKHFEENSLLDWIPNTKMYLYHGDADITVPYLNSLNTYNHFIASGAAPDLVSFTTFKGANHGSGVVPYLEEFFKVLIEMEAPL